MPSPIAVLSGTRLSSQAVLQVSAVVADRQATVAPSTMRWMYGPKMPVTWRPGYSLKQVMCVS